MARMPKIPHMSMDMNAQAGLHVGLRVVQLIAALVTMSVAAYGKSGASPRCSVLENGTTAIAEIKYVILHGAEHWLTPVFVWDSRRLVQRRHPDGLAGADQLAAGGRSVLDLLGRLPGRGAKVLPARCVN